MTHKSEENLSVVVVDVLFWGIKTCLVSIDIFY
jgi:hypothetical protein